MSDLVGKSLDQYQLLSLLGRGGMAAVYRSHQPSMDRDVAIKVISGQLADDPTFIARFEREARLIAKLQHPHILPVYDFGRRDGVLYLVMRLVEGGSLDERLRQGPLSLDVAAQMFTDIASALTYAHDQGIIHRDLKPNNILLDSKDNPYLTDFGIAKMMQDSTGQITATGTIIGTPSYMAPEMWRGEAVDARTDIYSLGIMLYEMVTGALPFKGDTPYALMYKHFDAPLPSLHGTQYDLPDALSAVINRAVAKKPQDRYGSADEMAADLRDALAGKSVTRAAKARAISKDDNEPTLVLGSPQAQRGGTDVTAPNQGRYGRLPLIGVVVVLALLLAGGAAVFLSSQAGNNANATATQAAVAALQIEVDRNARTSTAAALIPTATPSPQATATALLPTAVRFVDYSDQALNLTFRVPDGWNVQRKAGYGLLVSPNPGDLVFAQDGSISGAAVIQIVVGNGQSFGALDMVKATTPMEALVAMFGGERLQNLDPVSGTKFVAATTTRERPALGVVKVFYLMTLGHDRFLMVMQQTPPGLTDDYNHHITLPLVRTLNYATPPTQIPVVADQPTPTASGDFVMPTRFESYTNNGWGVTINYPRDWSLGSIGGTVQAVGFASSTKYLTNDINPPPYFVVRKLAQHDIQNYQPENSIVDLYRDNLGSMSENPEQIHDAPYLSAIGRSRGNTSLKVNGWLLLIELDNQNFLEVIAQAPRGAEDDYRNYVLLPLVESITYQANP